MARLPAAALLAALAVFPASSGDVLEVKVGSRWHHWWSADSAPAQWTGPHPSIRRAVEWRATAPGVELGELMVSGAGEAWRIRVVLVRLDTSHVRLRLQTGRRVDGQPGPWTIDSAPPNALVAVNAGQFDDHGPWGWIVENGIERGPPGSGPLAPALAVDTAGSLHWLPPGAPRPAGIVDAFQSYPTLLDQDGRIPAALRRPGMGVDHEHRDARVAIGFDREGRVLIALTRFAALGEALSRLPFGLTTPEMAALMGALGSDRAVLLDGGASSQLLVRNGRGTLTWRGIRRVPVGLLAVQR